MLVMSLAGMITISLTAEGIKQRDRWQSRQVSNERVKQTGAELALLYGQEVYQLLRLKLAE